MKGVVFTTFFEHVRSNHGDDWVDDLIDDVSPSNGGSYTRVGTYPFEEMVQFVSAYAQRTGDPLPVILERFGQFCFDRWVKTVPEHFNGASNLFDTLCQIDQFHENEVKKLYPEAELPSFQPVHRDEHRLSLQYRSCKPLADLAVGVIRGASEHYAEAVEISTRLEQQDGVQATFIDIERVGSSPI